MGTPAFPRSRFAGIDLVLLAPHSARMTLADRWVGTLNRGTVDVDASSERERAGVEDVCWVEWSAERDVQRRRW